MEFKLNKIEMDTRQKINMERSMDKVHTKKEIEVNKDKEQAKEEANGSGKKLKAKHDNHEETNEEKKDKQDKQDKQHDDRNGNISNDPNKGQFIDIKR